MVKMVVPGNPRDEELRMLYSGQARTYCHLYDAEAVEGTCCPRSIRCPDCRSTARRCHRPSDHEAQELHRARVAAAEAIDAAVLVPRLRAQLAAGSLRVSGSHSIQTVMAL